MKQFLFTSCRPGTRLGQHNEGIGVRAASRGLSVERCQGLGLLLRYTFEPAQPGKPNGPAPVRLAWLPHGDQSARGGQGVLVHVSYLPQDVRGRVGNSSFVHVVLPGETAPDLLDLIATWDADPWQRSDGDFGQELPDCTLPVGPLSQADIAAFLAHEENFAAVVALISAWLRAGDSGRFTLIAPPETVARCVYCLALAVPQVLLKSCSFSTYEAHPDSSDAWLTGTWGDGVPPIQAPALMRSDRCFPTLAQNRQPEMPYARQVAIAMRDGLVAEVRGFVERCQRASALDPMLELDGQVLEQLWQGRKHPETDPERLLAWLGQRGIARIVLGDPAGSGRLVRRLLDDPGFAWRVRTPLLAAVRRKEIDAAPLAAALNSEAVAATRTSSERYHLVVELLRELEAAPTYLDLVATAGPSRLAPGLHLELLPSVLAHLKPDDGSRSSWLDVGNGPSLLRVCQQSDADRISLADATEALLLALDGDRSLSKDVTAYLARYTHHLVRVLVAHPEALPRLTGVLERVIEWGDVLTAFGKAPVPAAILERVLGNDTALRRSLGSVEVLRRINRDDDTRRAVLRRAVEAGWGADLVSAGVPKVFSPRDLDGDLHDLCLDYLTSSDGQNSRHADTILRTVLPRLRDAWGLAGRWVHELNLLVLSNCDLSSAMQHLRSVPLDQQPALLQEWIGNDARSIERLRDVLTSSGFAVNSKRVVIRQMLAEPQLASNLLQAVAGGAGAAGLAVDLAGWLLIESGRAKPAVADRLIAALPEAMFQRTLFDLLLREADVDVLRLVLARAMNCQPTPKAQTLSSLAQRVLLDKGPTPDVCKVAETLYHEAVRRGDHSPLAGEMAWIANLLREQRIPAAYRAFVAFLRFDIEGHASPEEQGVLAGYVVEKYPHVEQRQLLHERWLDRVQRCYEPTLTAERVYLRLQAIGAILWTWGERAELAAQYFRESAVAVKGLASDTQRRVLAALLRLAMEDSTLHRPHELARFVHELPNAEELRNEIWSCVDGWPPWPRNTWRQAIVAARPRPMPWYQARWRALCDLLNGTIARLTGRLAP